MVHCPNCLAFFVNIDLGVHDVPIELLNVNGAYDKLLDFIEYCVGLHKV